MQKLFQHLGKYFVREPKPLLSHGTLVVLWNPQLGCFWREAAFTDYFLPFDVTELITCNYRSSEHVFVVLKSHLKAKCGVIGSSLWPGLSVGRLVTSFRLLFGSADEFTIVAPWFPWISYFSFFFILMPSPDFWVSSQVSFSKNAKKIDALSVRNDIQLCSSVWR